MQIKAVKHILADNDKNAAINREILFKTNTLGVNIISAPGSGKTTFLEKSIPAIKLRGQKASVIVGDLETARDAERVDRYTVDTVQINTGLSCHLYANQVTAAMEDMDLESVDYMFIENVGNMVCPGEFDLGENAKVILYSFPEGDDKAAKYPSIFRVADIVLLTKADMKEVCDFDIDRITADIRKLNNDVLILEVSAKTGMNMDRWLDWLADKRKSLIGRQARAVTE